MLVPCTVRIRIDGPVCRCRKFKIQKPVLATEAYLRTRVSPLRSLARRTARDVARAKLWHGSYRSEKTALFDASAVAGYVNRTVVVMPFHGGKNRAGHSNPSNRFEYLKVGLDSDSP